MSSFFVRAFIGFSLSLLISVASAFSQSSRKNGQSVRLSFVKEHAFPGDIVRVNIKASGDIAQLDLVFIEQRVMTHTGLNRRTWWGLLGIDLETKPGSHSVKGTATFSNGHSVDLEKTIRVLPKKFPVQRITVKEKYVTLDPEDAKRAEEESQKLRALWRLVSPENLWLGPFLSPVNSELTSGFGRRRIVNNQPRSPHSGVDLKAETGTPIQAANAGRVVLAEDLFFSGNTVVLDHGLGLYTYYAHCSKILVKTGEIVRKGQRIAEVGATGRVTGPHLHWACRLNQARVNPLDLTRPWMID